MHETIRREIVDLLYLLFPEGSMKYEELDVPKALIDATVERIIKHTNGDKDE